MIYICGLTWDSRLLGGRPVGYDDEQISGTPYWERSDV